MAGAVRTGERIRVVGKPAAGRSAAWRAGGQNPHVRPIARCCALAGHASAARDAVTDVSVGGCHRPHACEPASLNCTQLLPSGAPTQTR